MQKLLSSWNLKRERNWIFHCVNGCITGFPPHTLLPIQRGNHKVPRIGSTSNDDKAIFPMRWHHKKPLSMCVYLSNRYNRDPPVHMCCFSLSIWTGDKFTLHHVASFAIFCTTFCFQLQRTKLSEMWFKLNGDENCVKIELNPLF